MMSLNGKTVLITGASAGIGQALACEFSKYGMNLILAARRIERLNSLSAELTAAASSTQAISVQCDVTRPEDLKAAVSDGIEKFGKLDIVVANAGFSVTGKFENLQIEDFRRQFETNIFGVLNTIYATLDELKKTQGILAIIGSVSGYVPVPGTSAYSMSKFAIHSLAQTLTEELRPKGVSVVLIMPGFVDTEIRQVSNDGRYHPEKRDPVSRWLMMPAQSAARQIVRAISKRRPETVITVHGKLAVFLKRHFPWLVTQMIRRGKLAKPDF